MPPLQPPNQETTMRLLVNLASTIGLALVLSACGGSKKEDTTPAANESAPPAAEEGAAGGGEEGAAPAEGEGEQPPKEEGQKSQDQGGGGW
jgi:hypothetical protein